IVPLELGRRDAMADEDRLGIELFKFLLRLAGPGEALLAGDVECRLPLHDPERRLRTRHDTHERDRLEEGPRFAYRLEARLFELVRKVLCGEHLAPGAGAASLELIARQVGDVVF